MKQVIKYQTKSGKLFDHEEDAKRMEAVEEMVDKYEFFDSAAKVSNLNEETRELLIPYLFTMLKKGIIRPGGVVNKALNDIQPSDSSEF